MRLHFFNSAVIANSKMGYSLWGKWFWNWKSLLKIRYSINFRPHISKVAIATAAETLKFSGMKPQQHRVWLGNLDLDFKIRISDLQSNAKSENGFQRWDICFWIPLSPFDWEIRQRIWKNFLKNRGLAQARIISKKKTAVHESSFANPFFGFPNRTVKRKSPNSGFGFLHWNLPWGRTSRRWNTFSDFAFDCKSEIGNSQSNASLVVM